MTYEQFLSILNGYREYGRIVSEACNMGIDLLEGKFSTTSNVESIVENSIKSHYGDDGWDWVNWFIWETDYGMREDMRGWDEKGNLICYDYESLYNYLEKSFKNC